MMAITVQLDALPFFLAGLAAVFSPFPAFLDLALTRRVGAFGSFSHANLLQQILRRDDFREPPATSFSQSRVEATMDHTREHHSLLAAAEKDLLVAIARRLPPWLGSDHLTILGLLAMPAAGLAFAGIRLTPWSAALVAVALALNWFGDSLDGTLARVRRQPRPRYGYYVDHVIDLAGTAALVAGMAASGLMNPTIAIAVVAAYFLVSAETYLAAHSVGVFRLSFAGVGPTELRILLAIGAVFVARHPWVTVAGRPALLLDVGGIVAAVGLSCVFLLSAIRNTRALYLAEPLPKPAAVERAA
jgi:archaetidylinositol phosphate synthase